MVTGEEARNLEISSKSVKTSTSFIRVERVSWGPALQTARAGRPGWPSLLAVPAGCPCWPSLLAILAGRLCWPSRPAVPALAGSLLCPVPHRPFGKLSCGRRPRAISGANVSDCVSHCGWGYSFPSVSVFLFHFFFFDGEDIKSTTSHYF